MNWAQLPIPAPIFVMLVSVHSLRKSGSNGYFRNTGQIVSWSHELNGELVVNAQIVIGANLYALGILLEMTGEFVGNRNLALRGHDKQMRGRSRMIIGDTQRVINTYLRNKRRGVLLR